MKRNSSESLLATIDGQVEASIVLGGERTGTSRLVNPDEKSPFNYNPFDKKN